MGTINWGGVFGSLVQAVRGRRRSAAGLKRRIATIAYEVVSDLALPYRIQHVVEPETAADGWRISFFDPTASIGMQKFQVTIGPVRDLILDRAKAELATRLLERQSS